MEENLRGAMAVLTRSLRQAGGAAQSGVVRNLLGIAEDVTERRQAEVTLEAARHAADAASRFHAWIQWDPPLAQRQEDLAVWSEALRRASALDVSVEDELAA